jgi:hypothetical protein
MLHNWTIGGSGSGKTALNKLLCAGVRARGLRCAVLDPLRDGGWDADFITHDPDAYWRWLLAHQDERVACFWEECGIAVDRADRRFNLAACTGRHAGWRIYLITQRFKQVCPDVRDMAAERWIFRCSGDDAQQLVREYGRDELKELPNLPALTFFRVRPFKPLQKGSITFGARDRAQLLLRDL